MTKANKNQIHVRGQIIKIVKLFKINGTLKLYKTLEQFISYSFNFCNASNASLIALVMTVIKNAVPCIRDKSPH